VATGLNPAWSLMGRPSRGLRRLKPASTPSTRLPAGVGDGVAGIGARRATPPRGSGTAPNQADQPVSLHQSRKKAGILNRWAGSLDTTCGDYGPAPRSLVHARRI
jgi:hypothetical protein